MTDILCQWLNKEVKLSKSVDGVNFAREFASGYLVGEVLSKHQLQDDFDQFSQSRTSDSKLNNFTRLEPILHLLEIPFDTNIARDIMTEKHAVATRLMYQLFIALNKKVKSNLTGVAMETMRPAAPVKLEGVESLIYKERLKHMTPRQTDLNLDSLLGSFHKKQIEMEATAFKERFEDQERYEGQLQDQRQELIKKYKDNKAKKSEMLAKIQAATVHIPKPPANKTAKAIAQRRENRRLVEAQAMAGDIDVFEDKLKRTLPPSKPISDGDDDEAEVAALPDSLDLIKPSSNGEYIGKIRKRLNEDAQARSEREKRRRKVLVDQLKAHEAQEEARREEMLVNRLMRQSQQERRIAVQLLQTRHEKEVIRRNRLTREKQYEDRRLREFEEAMNREAEMARLAKLEYLEQTEKDKELHDKIMAERAEGTYRKHYDMCSEILDSAVDFTTKVGEYRDLTNRLLPEKLMREWTDLFVNGQPLYEVAVETTEDSEEPTPEQILEEERQLLLDEGDFNEYRNMIGEWVPPEGSEVEGPPRNNPIVGHIVQRLFNIVHPPSPPPPPPEFPPFPIKACVLGKVFSGKSTICKKLAENHRLAILQAEELVNEAIEANKTGEIIEIIEEEPEMESKPPTAAPESEAAPPTADSTLSAQPTNLDTESKASASKGGSARPSEKPTTAQTDNRTLEAEEASLAPSQPEEEGKEKTDAEKPVPAEEETAPQEDLTSNPMVKSAISGKSSDSSNKGRKRATPKPQATPRAKLGAKAMRFLKRGKAVDDSLMVDIIIEAMHRLPEGTGWVLDGYPTNYSQAKLLEKALSGFDAVSREPSKTNLKEDKKKKSRLAPDPRPSAPPAEPGSGINVIVMFDINNELALKRSAGRTYALQADSQFHQEFNPPPDGSATGVGKQERVLPVEDPAHDQEQCQHRLTAFQDAWPKLEKWFTKFGTLKKVDGAQELETVFLEVENMLEETIRKLQGGDEEETLIEEPPKEEEPEPEKAPEPEPIPEPPKEEERSRPTSRKSRGGSAKRSGSRGSSDKGKGKKDKTPSRSGSKADSQGKKSGKGSRGSSPKSPKRRGSGKKGKSPEPEPEPEPEVPSGPPPPEPGSDEWEYVDQPIEDDLAQIIAPHWENVESTYIGNNKIVFRNVREEREAIIRYFYSIRQDFLSFLKRPDHKQEFVNAWQQEFNEISDDIRDDEETRAELHERVDDLRERLWSICDERKEQAEKEREAVIADGWVDDRTGILSNHYISLMQNETDRFQDTCRMLKDYYRGMEGKIPDELSAEYARIPLVELPPTDRPQSPAKSEAGSQAGEGGSKAASPAPGAAGTESDLKSVPSKSATPSGKKKKGDVEAELPPEGDEEKRPRIPLVPRRPVSPDPATAAGGKGKGDKGKGKPPAEDTPSPPMDPDEKLIFDAHLAGLQYIDKIMAAEQAAKEAEEEAERQREAEREAEKQKAAAAAKKGGKKDKSGKKSRSPSPKKGKGKETPSVQPTPPPEEESPEEKEKKLTKEKARKEFFAAIQEEANAAKTRLDLARAVANGVLADLKNKADGAYKDMNDWLGARFLKEMESIDHMSQTARHAIEGATKIQEELLLKQEDFLVNTDVKVLKTPSPVPRPTPVEDVMPETFTVDQIMSIYKQFALTAPAGMLSLKAFQEVFLDLASLTHGTETMPDIWTQLSPEKLDTMAVALSPDGQYIDWRTFLLQSSHPWPVPTQADLLDTLARFHEMDQKRTGTVTREQFDMVELWFRGGTKPPTPADPGQPLPYDRLDNLKMAFFDLFADHTQEPSELDYVSMLMYFSISPDAYDGFLRALSVASGSHMPRLAKKICMRKASRPASQASLAVSVDLEVEKPGEEEAGIPEDIPECALQSKVPLDALDRVLHHGQSMRGDSHRFSVTSDPEDAFSRERLAGVYQEVGADELEPVAFSMLVEHPVLQDIISNCSVFKAIDLRSILNNPAADQLMEIQSMKTAE